MTFTIVQRHEYGLPATVTSSNGSPRPAMGQGNRYVTYHYTGVNVTYATRSTPAEILKIQATFASTKPFEYNYVIGQENDDLIYEYAGLYQAAHSAGENHDAFGFLFLNGVNEPLTDLQVRKSQWLRDQLVAQGHLMTPPDQRPHQQMPDAATACPGTLIMSRMPDLYEPYWEPEPQPEPEEDDTMRRFVLVDTRNGATYLVNENSKTWINDGDVIPQLHARIRESAPGSDPNTAIDIVGTQPSPVDGMIYRFKKNGNGDFIASYGPIIGPRPANVNNWGK